MNHGPAGGAFERPRRAPVQVLRRLTRYFKPHWPLLLAAAVLSVLANLLALVAPKLSGAAIDAIRPEAVDFPVVGRYVLLMILCAGVSALMSFGLARLMIHLSRSVVYQMRKDLFHRLGELPISFFDTHAAGDVISVFSYDVDTVNASLSNDLTQLLASAITVGGSLYMMLTLSPLLVLVFVVTIPLSLLFTRFRARRVRPLYRARSQRLGEMNGFVEESVSGLKTIKAYGREEAFEHRFQEKNEAAVSANYDADAFGSVTGPTVNFLSNLSLALVSLFGALMYMAGGVSLGNISSFVLYSRKFSGPINEFANLVSELQSALAAAERVLALIDAEQEPADAPDAQPVQNCRGAVSLRDVCFGYDPQREILHHISCEISPGQVIAIVGETGCGKTTLINLLMRFYDVSSGAILLDGRDIRSYQRQSLRRQFTMVLQDTWLFEGTIEENIAYGVPGAGRAEVIAAAKAAHIHEAILSLPQGYDTRLTGDGGNISKGQKQLLTIARAMLLQSPMLILDEATSNVDTQTEKAIADAMLALMRGRTCFVIAHRLSTIVGADCILCMQDGRIAERGTHAALLAQNGIYAAMYRAQFDHGEESVPTPAHVAGNFGHC